ncbi:phosphogluconate dehydratase [Nocardioides sp. Kera G14]|uniref:phosphogluconate dehydratase n=1 Tax=Nocardioides sp. Kera G14 TaxID=2884264 RepID=UPI001D10FA68|nr:phosphogluconate dehydratase [Nocardioides sp. Kera G14]UDY23957.1 phosphogluconate dehydratase [Nocardioides sp. Kera G14]
MTHPTLTAVTERIVERSRPTRTAYLQRLSEARLAGPARGRLGCGNLAHGFAAAPVEEKRELQVVTPVGKPNVAIVTSYNDMLSAHAPYVAYPPVLKQAVIRAGGLAQVAGGVPAMCDGITQGRDGMQLSLFSRDVIAMSAAIGLSHDMFDAALMLGVCDKIVPGLVIGALSFGHLPTAFVPAGPMTSGLPNAEKSRIRQLHAEGKVGREELLAAESSSYHSAGTCTFYGTANSNQLLMEVLGLHLPGSSFVNPGTELREALTRATAAQVTALALDGGPGIGEMVDERAIVNACVALLASGGSTNHTMHLVAMARAAGIVLTWDDLSDLSSVVPLLARVYPNGEADVNHFHAAGGIGFLIRTLLSAGLMHEDVQTIMGRGLSRYTSEPQLDGFGLGATPLEPGVVWVDGPASSYDESVLRAVDNPFSADGGLRVLHGPLGTSVIKVSAVKPEHRFVSAPAAVFDDQADFLAAFASGALDGRDFVAVLRYQGPAANGMPELHKLTPALGVLQDRGQRVALVTDGRMSGASGKVPAAIHVTPEAALGGVLAKVRDGDLVTVDADRGVLTIDVPAEELAFRPATGRALSDEEWVGTGRELFAAFRHAVGRADLGASVFATPSASQPLARPRTPSIPSAVGAHTKESSVA